jgi:hypothetical protein
MLPGAMACPGPGEANHLLDLLYRSWMTRSSSLGGVELQIENLVLWTSAARIATCHQTPGLALAARICDHIATKPRVTGGDSRLGPASSPLISTNGDAKGPGGRARTDDADYGSGGWGFESLAARHQHRSSAALPRGRYLLWDRRTATQLRPRRRALPTPLRPPATPSPTTTPSSRSRHPPAAAVGDRAALGIPTSSRQTSLSRLRS